MIIAVLFAATMVGPAVDNEAIRLLSRMSAARAQLRMGTCGNAALDARRVTLDARAAQLGEKWIARLKPNMGKVMRAFPPIVDTVPVQCPDSQAAAADQLEQAVSGLENMKD